MRRDPSYEGIFWVGVKTTGIFCRPTCPARKPKKANVLFYQSCQEALSAGYRPCKVCSPLLMVGETPPRITSLLKELSSNPTLKMNDRDLRMRGIEPNKIRRWFKKHHNITFQAYQRMLRINNAFKRMKDGESVTSAAFESGFESLSGFQDSFKSLVGTSPSNGKHKRAVTVTRLATPLGPMIAGSTDEGICLLEFSDRRMLETEFRSLARRLDAVIIHGVHELLETMQLQLTEYFEGKRKQFDVPLHKVGTEFQKKTWAILQKIPYGFTVSYKEQAQMMRNATAVRAVANANGQNKIAIIIPCHRVIGEDGTLTGYGGGLWRKQWLLDHERYHRAVGSNRKELLPSRRQQ